MLIFFAKEGRVDYEPAFWKNCETNDLFRCFFPVMCRDTVEVKQSLAGSRSLIFRKSVYPEPYP
jgi:hypothetical protein